MSIEGLKYYLEDKRRVFEFFNSRGFFKNMSDEQFLRKKFKSMMGYPLDLDNPKTFCEKIQWLKLYDRNPLYHQLVDKYAVKKYAAEKLGEEHVLPVLGVWEHFDDIDFDSLPNQFVLKCTHDSGGLAICTDKASFNREAAKAKIEKCLAFDYFQKSREWAYKDVPRKIIAEPYLDSLGKPDSIEYKLICMGGKVVTITVCVGIAHVSLNERTNDTYDRDYKHRTGYAFYKNAPMEPGLPPQIDEIVSYAEKLSEGIPQVRCDFYVHEGKVYFGEMTFYTWSGFMDFEPRECDELLGSYLVLPEKRT